MRKTGKSYYFKLYDLVSLLNSERDPKDLLSSFVKSVANAMGTKACSLMLLTPDKEVLLHTVAYGLSDWYVRKGPVKAGKIISDVLAGKSVTVLEADKDDRVLYREAAKKEGIASILSVPMKLRGDVIGVLRVYTERPYRFTKDDVHFAEAVADLGALALENLRAFDIIQKDYETFCMELLQWRAELGYEWTVEETRAPSPETGPKIPPGG